MNQAPEQLYGIGLAILTEAGVKDWTFREGRGEARPKTKHVACPKPTTPERLYTLAHESAHIALGHEWKSKSVHRGEFEAERYAHEALRRYGVRVPKRETYNARNNVARAVERLVRFWGKSMQYYGGLKLDREAVEWSKSRHGEVTKKALRDGTVELVDENDN